MDDYTTVINGLLFYAESLKNNNVKYNHIIKRVKELEIEMNYWYNKEAA